MPGLRRGASCALLAISLAVLGPDHRAPVEALAANLSGDWVQFAERARAKSTDGRPSGWRLPPARSIRAARSAVRFRAAGLDDRCALLTFGRVQREALSRAPPSQPVAPGGAIFKEENHGTFPFRPIPRALPTSGPALQGV